MTLAHQVLLFRNFPNHEQQEWGVPPLSATLPPSGDVSQEGWLNIPPVPKLYGVVQILEKTGCLFGSALQIFILSNGLCLPTRSKGGARPPPCDSSPFGGSGREVQPPLPVLFFVTGGLVLPIISFLLSHFLFPLFLSFTSSLLFYSLPA